VAAFLFSQALDPESRAQFLRAAADPRSYRVIAFTAGQAALSAAIALAIGIPMGIISSRIRLPGKKALQALFSIPFTVPSVLLALGFARFYGRQGFVNDMLAAAGGPRLAFIYGFSGVILAHSFYNFPIAARFVSDALARRNPAQAEAARLLGAGPLRRFFTITLPEAFPGMRSAFLLIFLYCLQSFGIVLLLGGGPRASTLETEIFAALRTTFEDGRAIYFGLWELMIGLALVFLYSRSAPMRNREARSSRRDAPGLLPGPGQWALIIPYLAFLIFFLGGPLLSILLAAFSSQAGQGRPESLSLGNLLALFSGDSAPLFIRAILNTLAVSLLAAGLSLAMGLLMVASRRSRAGKGIAVWAAALPMAVSPLLLSASISSAAGQGAPLPALALFHALLALPLTVQALDAGMAKLPASLFDAARLLGTSRATTFLRIGIPLLRPAILSAIAFAVCVSAGDLSGPLILGSGNLATLPLMVFRAAGAYRFGLAAMAGIILLCLTGTAFSLTGSKR
jgi:thiamine transport system permease protein